MYSSLSLRWKILLALTLLSVVPLSLALFLVSGATQDQLDRLMQQRAQEVAAFAGKSLESSAREAANYIRLASQNADLVNSIYFAESSDTMLHLGSTIEDVQRIFNFDLVQVLNAEGVILRRSLTEQRQDVVQASDSDHALIQAAMTGESVSALDEFDGLTAIVAVSPVRFHKKTIGYLVGVIYLDEIYAARIKELGGAEVAFYNESGGISATDPELAKFTFEDLQGRQQWSENLGGVPFELYNRPFSDHDEGMLIALDRSEMLSAQGKLRSLLITILAGVGTLAVLVGIGISRGIVRPLADVVQNLKDIAEGGADLTRTLEVNSSDEVGELAASFNRFMGRLRDMVLRTQVVRKGLGAAAELIRGSSAEVNQGAVHQSQTLEECHEALEKIDQTLAGIAQSTGTLLDAAEESSSATLELGATVEEIAEQMERLFATVEEVSASIGEMSVSSQQINDNLESLSSSTEITASSITEMDAAIKEIEENAERTNSLSEEAARDAEKGKEAVDATISGINGVRQIVDEACAVIQNLGAQSSAIGTILTVIDEVTDQTSLLALNAAIIAAQAGDHGRGFAVVADEIRQLADRTAVSTGEIGAIITNLQSGTRKAVEAMSAGSRRVHKEVARSQAAGDALEKIRTSTLKSTEQVRGIVRATQEQAKGSQQITMSINQVAAMLGQIASAVNQQADGNHQLANAADAMREIASKVKYSTSEQAKGGRQINISMENIRTMIERINEATGEQALRSRQVVEAVSRIRPIAENNVSRTAELDKVVETLAQQTATLEAEVGAFKA